jgi:TIR domain
MAAGPIFIAYSHRDALWEEKVERHLRVLQQALPGLDIWDDKRIVAGDDWLPAIETAISSASIAILLVSDKFLTSEFITRKEVPLILKRRSEEGLIVFPIIVTACAWKTVPWLGGLQARPAGGRSLAALRHKANDALADLTTEVFSLLGAKTATASEGSPALLVEESPSLVVPNHFPVGSRIPLPCFFPSVSGAAKSVLTPLDHLRVLVALSPPCFLASVYDFANARAKDQGEMKALIARALAQGTSVLLDSGLYERTWLRDSSWSRRRFRSTLSDTPCTLAFSYDPEKQTTIAQFVTDVISDRKATKLNALFPIVHADRARDLPDRVTSIAKRLDSPIVAVAERELGGGVFEAARTVLKLRRTLNGSGRYRVLHVLGTGNPLSMLVYSVCGADSYDGLDWCQTVTDRDTMRLHHNQQLDFFTDQTEYARGGSLPYQTRAIAHNIECLRGWMATLHEHRAAGTLRSLVDSYLPAVFGQRLLELLETEVD